MPEIIARMYQESYVRMYTKILKVVNKNSWLPVDIPLILAVINASSHGEIYGVPEDPRMFNSLLRLKKKTGITPRTWIGYMKSVIKLPPNRLPVFEYNEKQFANSVAFGKSIGLIEIENVFLSCNWGYGLFPANLAVGATCARDVVKRMHAYPTDEEGQIFGLVRGFSHIAGAGRETIKARLELYAELCDRYNSYTWTRTVMSYKSLYESEFRKLQLPCYINMERSAYEPEDN